MKVEEGQGQIQGASAVTCLGDLKTWKSTGTSCQIEIHFSIQIIKFLMKYLIYFVKL